MAHHCKHASDVYIGAISMELALSQAPANTTVPRIRTVASCGVPIYSPAYAGNHCAYPHRDGQAE